MKPQGDDLFEAGPQAIGTPHVGGLDTPGESVDVRVEQMLFGRPCLGVYFAGAGPIVVTLTGFTPGPLRDLASYLKSAADDFDRELAGQQNAATIAEPVPVHYAPVDDLLSEYAEVLNRAGGPDAPEAERFLRDRRGRADFQSLARTAEVVWKAINRR